MNKIEKNGFLKILIFSIGLSKKFKNLKKTENNTHTKLIRGEITSIIT